MNPAPLSSDAAPGGLNVAYIARLLYRHAIPLGALLLVSMGIALAYLHFATPYYRSTASLQVEQEAQRAFRSDGPDDAADDLKSDDVLKTIEANLQSPDLFLRVAADPSILHDPRLLTGVSRHPLTIQQLADFLQANTHADLRHGTRLIDVSVDHPVPQMAQRLCEALVESYILQNSEISTSASTDAEGVLSTDSNGIKNKLQQSEDALATYRDVLELKDRVSDQQRILDALEQRYRAKHPTMIQARTLMASLVDEFDADVQKIRTNSLESAYWTQHDASLQGLPEEERVAVELRMVAARTSVLEDEVATEKSLFNNVLKQSTEASIDKSSAPTAAFIRSEASLPQRPVRPKKSIILVLGLAAGLGLGLAALFALETLDSSFKTAEEVEQYLVAAVLGTIPEINPRASPGATSTKNSLVLISEPGGIAAESFRSLRASLGLLGRPDDHRTLLLTSALAGEGKTFVSGNYAVSLAQQGIKTLLIDADLRCPTVHTLFHLQNQDGLVDLVAHGVPLREAVYQDVVRNLDILTAGTKCPNPAELLAGPGFAETLQEAVAQYDRVIIDSTPLNLVSDALLLIPQVQSVLLVVRANHTPRRDARYALSTIHRAGKEPIGVVINAVPDWTRSLYYSHPGRYVEGQKYYRAYSNSR